MIGLLQSEASIAITLDSSVVLGQFRSSTKIPVVALELEGSSWDSLSAFVFSLQGICVNYIYENPSHNCLTNSLYFLNKGSFTSYSPKTCRTTNWESMNTISFLTLIFLASHRLASKASCAEYLNSSLFRPISRIPALAPLCANDPSTYTDQTFDS